MLIYMSSVTINPLVLFAISIVSILLPVYLIWTVHRISYGAWSNHILTVYQD